MIVLLVYVITWCKKKKNRLNFQPLCTGLQETVQCTLTCSQQQARAPLAGYHNNTHSHRQMCWRKPTETQHTDSTHKGPSCCVVFGFYLMHSAVEVGGAMRDYLMHNLPNHSTDHPIKASGLQEWLHAFAITTLRQIML